MKGISLPPPGGFKKRSMLLVDTDRGSLVILDHFSELFHSRPHDRINVQKFNPSSLCCSQQRITYPTKSAWAHTTSRFWCFSNLFGIKVNNSIARGSGSRSEIANNSASCTVKDNVCFKFCIYLQPSFVRGCIVGKPTTVCQPLDHCEHLN
jgi:hypothetical protein